MESTDTGSKGPLTTKSGQNLANHIRFDAKYHFFIAPLGLLVTAASFAAAVYYHGTRPDVSAWLIAATALQAQAAIALVRLYGLQVQDRVIRLETAYRYDRLAPAGTRFDGGVGDRLTVSQTVALRFSPDSELVELAARAADEKLTSTQIKQAIRAWRGDYARL